MATGLAVLMTCLYTACGGGNGVQGAGPLSFADVGADDASGVLVAAAGNTAMPQAAGGRKAASGVPPGHNKGESPTRHAPDPDADSDSDPRPQPRLRLRSRTR